MKKPFFLIAPFSQDPSWSLGRGFSFWVALLFHWSICLATDFSQEPFLVPHSVSANGTALLIPTQAGSPMNFLDWPAGSPVRGKASVEASTQPLFDGLSHAILGAAHYPYDAKTRIFAMTGIVGTDQIPVRPLLLGTQDERRNHPEMRPSDCSQCEMLNDQVYLGAINVQRAIQGQLPRSGISSQPIPFTFWSGVTTKYFWEELEGDDYTAQALNLDAGISLSVALDYDPVERSSDRDLILQFSGFELLPTPQRSEMGGGYIKDETAPRRWHVGLQWKEAWRELKSSTLIGFTQRSEAGRWPGMAAEWNVRDAVFMRLGYDGTTWASGISLHWRVLTLHYALQKHPLGTTWYQVSMQAEWPEF